MSQSVSRAGSGLLEMLTLERIEDNYFRTAVFSSEPGGLYGGQVAAQALRAGAETVPPGRHAHSCHGYFLSRGDASRPVGYVAGTIKKLSWLEQGSLAPSSRWAWPRLRLQGSGCDEFWPHPGRRGGRIAVLLL